LYNNNEKERRQVANTRRLKSCSPTANDNSLGDELKKKQKFYEVRAPKATCLENNGQTTELSLAFEKSVTTMMEQRQSITNHWSNLQLYHLANYIVTIFRILL